MRFDLTGEMVLLLVIANATPVITAGLLGKHLNQPLDGNRVFIDRRPWLGPSKTWRGLLSALLVTSLMAPLFGLTIVQGALFGLLAMLGDLLSSFMKRRTGKSPGTSVPLLDQLPEALLPLGVMRPVFAASWLEILAAALAFMLIDLALSHALRQLHKNDQLQ
jgi:CDP-2,3-bis-(O-geranylgeranyl)-sn-glycerol synthase